MSYQTASERSRSIRNRSSPDSAWPAQRAVSEAKLERLVHHRDDAASVQPPQAGGLNRTEGLTKLIVDKETDLVLGVGIVGVEAGEVIAEAMLAVEMSTSARDLALTMHAHPTLSETVLEAAESLYGLAVHMLPKK